MTFSPRNGEIILKSYIRTMTGATIPFQSPQWGDNSKGKAARLCISAANFQSPQWGDNSKGHNYNFLYKIQPFSPRNGEIILKY